MFFCLGFDVCSHVCVSVAKTSSCHVLHFFITWFLPFNIISNQILLNLSCSGKMVNPQHIHTHTHSVVGQMRLCIQQTELPGRWSTKCYLINLCPRTHTYMHRHTQANSVSKYVSRGDHFVIRGLLTLGQGFTD